MLSCNVAYVLAHGLFSILCSIYTVKATAKKN